MRERALLIGARLEVVPASARGTEVRLHVPVRGLTMPIRILIADDHTLVRAGLRRILDDEVDIEVVAEAEDGAEAVRARSARVDLAILDISMPS